MSEKFKPMVDYILDIDWMTTTEFCEKYQIPKPRFYPGATPEEMAGYFLQVEAIKAKIFIEYAKQIKRAIPINKPESLTKENFWNELYDKYPDKMKVFCSWVDEYKEKVNWEQLFGNAGKKYHDLPIAMQIGIFIQFTTETERVRDFILDEPESMQALADEIKMWFKWESETE